MVGRQGPHLPLNGFFDHHQKAVVTLRAAQAVPLLSTPLSFQQRPLRLHFLHGLTPPKKLVYLRFDFLERVFVLGGTIGTRVYHFSGGSYDLAAKCGVP